MNKIDLDTLQIETSYFLEDAPGFNVPRIKEIFISKCIELATKGQTADKPWFFITNIRHEQKHDLHYFYFESGFEGMTGGMKRYHLGVYSMLLFDLHYYDSNVIGVAHEYTLEEVQQRFKNYLTAMLNQVS